MLFLIIFLHSESTYPSLSFPDEPRALSLNTFWTLTEVYPDQIVTGTTPCRWADINVDLFSFTPAQNLVPLFFFHLNLAFKKKKTTYALPFMA